MTTRGTRSERKGKEMIRAGNRSGSRSGKQEGAARNAPRRDDPIVCERCGAVWSRRTWRRDRAVTTALLARARWRVCPACRQVVEGRAFGRVLLRGGYVRSHEPDIRRRIANVVDRARFTQPERRVVSIDAHREGLEVLTTSQKLAHRVVRELEKAFRGRASYSWSDRDGTLFATWTRER
jgi:NMD protein affecting ribosome stability and mRNA decay